MTGDGYAYIQTNGRRLGWVKSILAEADVDVAGVQRSGDGSYMVAIEPYELERAKAALEPITNYERKPKRQELKALDLRLFDLLIVAGVAVAGIVALVTPLGAGVVLALMAFGRWAFGQMHEPAAELWKLGGKWRLSSIVGVIVVLLVFVAFLASAGYMAAAEIAGGNSALKLLGG